MRLKADLTLLLVSIFWGSAFVAQRIAGQLGVVYLFNGARYLLAALVVLLFLVGGQFLRGCGPSKKIQREQYGWMAIAGILLFLASAIQQAGILYTTAGNAGFITSLYVVLVPVLLALFWGEKRHWVSVVAVGLAGGGAFLLSTGGRLEIHVGDALELLGVLFWALHVIVVGKFASKFESMTFSVGQLCVCAILNLATGAFVEKSITLTCPLLSAIAYTAILALGLCFTLQIWAQKHTPPADAALILSLESVFAVLAGWLILDERLASIQIAGCLLIFGAVVMSQFQVWRSDSIDPGLIDLGT